MHSAGLSSPTATGPKRRRKREQVAESLGWNYITSVGRENAKSYVYNGKDLSLIYKYFSSPFAQYLVDHFTPRWMAPNMITLIGLALVALSTGVLQYFCPKFECPDDVPQWPWYLAAFCLFAYGTLDNMDGKQARRTGSSSSLGLLFDHGCDALNTCVFTVQNACVVAQIGSSTLSGLHLFTAFAGGFYLATWEEFHLDVLVLPIINGPNEGLFAMCIAFIATGLFGNKLFVAPAFSDYRVIDVLVMATAVAAAITMLSQVYHVCADLTKKKEGVIRPLGRLTPLVIVLGVGWLWAIRSFHLYRDYPVVFLCTLGCLITDSVSKLMVSHVCGQRYRPNWLLIATFALPALYCSLSPLAGAAVDEVIEARVLMVLFVIVACSLVFFILYAVNELADALGIRVLHIKPTKAE